MQRLAIVFAGILALALGSTPADTLRGSAAAGNTAYRLGADKEASDSLITNLAKHAAYLAAQPRVAQTPIPFTCEPYGGSDPTPTSVHKLTPGDIKVVAALGDSLTAAFGAKATWSTFYNAFTEYRGVSFSAGGDENVTTTLTMPNILRQYNPNVIGFSLGTGTARRGLNVAVSGSVAQDIPAQVADLITTMKATPGVDFINDWKLITLFIGGNDLCDYCKDKQFHMPDNYEAALRASLTAIQQNIPRVLVNLVSNLDVTQLYPVKEGFCEALHLFECPCGTSYFQSVRDQVRAAFVAYNARIEEIANDPVYATTEDFTIVVQPFFVNTVPPKIPGTNTTDLSYFAMDCFHFSELGHQAAAVALWNSMVEPVGQKRTDWHVGEPIECPVSGSYIYTNKNSATSAMAQTKPTPAASIRAFEHAKGRGRGKKVKHTL